MRCSVRVAETTYVMMIIRRAIKIILLRSCTMADQQSLESTLMSDDSQLNTSDITSQSVGHLEHRVLWNSYESTQVIILFNYYISSL